MRRFGNDGLHDIGPTDPDLECRALMLRKVDDHQFHTDANKARTVRLIEDVPMGKDPARIVDDIGGRHLRAAQPLQHGRAGRPDTARAI